jgi:hypothetical protein
MAIADPVYAVLLSRIRLAVRRVTGKMVEVEAIFANPTQVQAQIFEWRALNSPELNQLLHQYEQMKVTTAVKTGAVKSVVVEKPPETGPDSRMMVRSARGMARGPVNVVEPEPPPNKVRSSRG